MKAAGQLKVKVKPSMCVCVSMTVSMYNVCMCMYMHVWIYMYECIDVHLWALATANERRMYLPLTTVTGVLLCDVRERLPAYCTLAQVFHSLVNLLLFIMNR